MMSDTMFVLSVLEDGPATTNEILARSYATRGVGCMVHSRIADVRKRLPEGWRVTCDRLPNHNGRPQYRYTLVPPVAQLTLEGAA